MNFADWQPDHETFGEWLAGALTEKVRLDPDLSAWLGTDADGNARFYTNPPDFKTIAGLDEAGNVNEFYRGIICKLSEAAPAQWQSGEANVTKYATISLVIFDRSDDSDQSLYDAERYWLALFEPPARATLTSDMHADWRTSRIRFEILTEFERHNGEHSAALGGLVAAVSTNPE